MTLRSQQRPNRARRRFEFLGGSLCGLAVPDSPTHEISQLLEELCPLVLPPGTHLDLQWVALWKHDHVNGAVAVHRLGSAIDDLGRTISIAEQRHDPFDQLVLPHPVEVAHDPHAGEILDALET